MIFKSVPVQRLGTLFFCFGLLGQAGCFQKHEPADFVVINGPGASKLDYRDLPPVIICFINAMVYLIPLSDYTARISIGVGTLTGLVLFHVSLQSQLPSSRTITLADYFLITSYMLNLFTWVTTMTTMLMFKSTFVPERTTREFTLFGYVVARFETTSAYGQPANES